MLLRINQTERINDRDAIKFLWFHETKTMNCWEKEREQETGKRTVKNVLYDYCFIRWSLYEKRNREIKWWNKNKNGKWNNYANIIFSSTYTLYNISLIFQLKIPENSFKNNKSAKKEWTNQIMWCIVVGALHCMVTW